jgi:hypothetical protein
MWKAYSVVAGSCLLISTALFASGAGTYAVGPGMQFSTIQAALNQLWVDQGTAAFSSPQYIIVYGGSYNIYSSSLAILPNSGLNPTSNNKLIIQAAPGTAPLINGRVAAYSEGCGFPGITISTPNTVIKGLSIQGYEPGIQVTGAAACVIDSCAISKCCGEAIEVDSSSSTVRYCNIISNACDGVCISSISSNLVLDSNITSGGKGVMLQSCTGTIRNNYISTQDLDYYPIEVYSSSTVNIFNNILVNSNADGYAIESLQGNSGVQVVNNIFISPKNEMQVSSDSNGGFISDYNDFYNTGNGININGLRVAPKIGPIENIDSVG